MAQSTITTPNLICLAVDGTVAWSKNPDELDYVTMSVIKAFTVYYILETGAFPDRTITRPMASGPVTPPVGELGRFDVVTVDDEIYAALLYSDNYAVTDLALWSVGQTHHSHIAISFLPPMRAWLTSTFGWTGFTLNNASGVDTNIFSARMIAEMGHAILATQPWQVDVMSTASYTTTVDGPNARTLTMDFKGGPIKAAVEAGGGVWLGSKGGAGSGTYSQVILWRHPTDAAKTYSIGLLGAPSMSIRNADITTVVSDVLDAVGSLPVTANVPTADDTANTISWTPLAGVQYVIGGSVRTPPYSVGDVTTSVTVAAQATPGYVLTGTSSWSFSFTGSDPDPSGLFATDGSPVTLHLTSGDPIVLT